RLAGASVQLGRGEAATVAALGDPEASPPVQPAMLRQAGADQLARHMQQLAEVYDRGPAMPLAGPDGWLDHGDRVAVGARTLEVVATPGHTRGHVVLRDEAAGVLFAGDHVLPHITPSLGYERCPEPSPLRSYLQSLRLVRDLP